MYNIDHHYVTVIGDSYTSTERWQFGLRLVYGGASNTNAALALAPLIEAWWRGTAPYDPAAGKWIAPTTTHRLTELKVAHIALDGTYVDGEPSYSHLYLPPIAGTQAPPAGQLPQATVAVTLTTAVPKGLASKGRIYLPPSLWYQPVAADGLIPATNGDHIAQAMKLLLQAINGSDVVGDVHIFSKGKGVAAYDAAHKRVEYTYPTPGTHNAVTGVRVGRVVDTQRRRRRSLNELYQVAAL